MGQFSWVCALCSQEIMHGNQPGYQWTTEAVILWPNGDRRSGQYVDGYGEIAGINLVDESSDWRIVHQRCYQPVKHLPTKELFASFKKDRHADDQGWWPGEGKMVERYGEPNLSEIKSDMDYVCYGCDRVWSARWSGGVCPFGCVKPDDYPTRLELVEPFGEWIAGLGKTDGVIICRNVEKVYTDWARYHEMRAAGTLDETNPPTKIEPCHWYGEKHQARIHPPDDWLEEAEYYRSIGKSLEPHRIRCTMCSGEEFTVVKLERVSI